MQKLISNSWYGRIERLDFLSEGRLGQLIDVSFETAKFINDPLQYISDGPDDMLLNVYNKEKKEYQQLFSYQVPRTYSFLPRPKNIAMELDYFVRASCLVKHEIIWYTKTITKANFAKLASTTNQSQKYKYTVAPWMPDMKDICKPTMYPMYFIEGQNRQNDQFIFYHGN